MKNGFICKWDLNELNREWGDMAMHCWNWRGCPIESKFISIPADEKKKHCCKGSEQDSDDNCQDEYVTHPSRYIIPMTKGKSYHFI